MTPRLPSREPRSNFDRGPIHGEHLVLGGYWSTYWYNGKIYGTEIARGLDVFTLEASDHLTENEIAAAQLADQGNVFNPQQQTQVTWPVHPSVALAYLDQLGRDRVLASDLDGRLRSALTASAERWSSKESDRALARELRGLSEAIDGASSTEIVANRLIALRDQLSLISDQLR